MNIGEAIRSIDPNVSATVTNNEYDTIEWIKGGPIPKEQIDAEIVKLKAEWESKQYQRDRAESYPDLKEQLDLLWHAIDDGKFNVKSKDTDFYKKLKAVKDANPKPE